MDQESNLAKWKKMKLSQSVSRYCLIFRLNKYKPNVHLMLLAPNLPLDTVCAPRYLVVHFTQGSREFEWLFPVLISHFSLPLPMWPMVENLGQQFWTKMCFCAQYKLNLWAFLIRDYIRGVKSKFVVTKTKIYFYG